VLPYSGGTPDVSTDPSDELAEIVTGLLVKPELLGQFPDEERHIEFIHQIGKVVAEFCGGQINGVHAPDGSFSGQPFCDAPLMSVWPDDRLPDLQHCVWGPYDPEGWEGVTADTIGIEQAGEPLPMKPGEIRKALQSLLAEAHRAQVSESRA
jgi:hypothetical protein